jgi:hypothetical protein
MGTCMPAKQTVIDINDEQFKSILEKVEARLPPKPKQGMTLREAISKFKPTITKALRRGYTYEEVASSSYTLLEYQLSNQLHLVL